MSQLSLQLGESAFCQYHQDNPQVYVAFKDFTWKTIARGFKHYSAKGVFELVRWHTGVAGNDQFKINNNYTPFYARLFEKDYPEHAGFFRQRESKFDEKQKGTSV
jgi:hypothetical protein